MSLQEAFEFDINAAEAEEPIPLARALRNRLPETPWNTIRAYCAKGKVTVDGALVLDPRRKVEVGARIVINPAAQEPGSVPRTAGPVRILFEDTQIIVVDKPPGVATVPHEAGERSTLLDLIRRVWRVGGLTDPKSPLMVVQRLDRETSGAIVLARTEAARSILSSAFRYHNIEREYVAVVQGEISWNQKTIQSRLAADRGDGIRGSVKPPQFGKEAITHVRVLERLAGATVVQCRLETGRTHQVRIHLSEAGHPILGEAVYIREYAGTKLDAPRICLHALRLGFTHPRTGRSMRFLSPVPDDMQKVITTLGGKNPSLLLEPEPEPASSRDTFEREVRDWWKAAPEGSGERRRERDPARPHRDRRDASSPRTRELRAHHQRLNAQQGERMRDSRGEGSQESGQGASHRASDRWADWGKGTRFPMMERGQQRPRGYEEGPSGPRKRVRPPRPDPEEAGKAQQDKLSKLEEEVHAMLDEKVSRAPFLDPKEDR